MALRMVRVLCFSGNAEQEEQQPSPNSQRETKFARGSSFRFLLGARRSFREKSYTRHMGRNCNLKTAQRVKWLCCENQPTCQLFPASHLTCYH